MVEKAEVCTGCLETVYYSKASEGSHGESEEEILAAAARLQLAGLAANRKRTTEEVVR